MTEYTPANRLKHVSPPARHSPRSLQEISSVLEDMVSCNCDLENWSREPETNHTCACRIDRISRNAFRLTNRYLIYNLPYDEVISTFALLITFEKVSKDKLADWFKDLLENSKPQV